MPTIAENLKASTRSMHDAAEHSSFQGQLASGLLPVNLYLIYLQQLFLIHQHLEEAINSIHDKDNRLSKVITPDQLQEPYLRQDLNDFQINPEQITALGTTKKLLASIEITKETNPIALTGYHYVLLGSKHGSKFIAHNLSKTLNKGILYFDPYGNGFQPIWRHFIDTLNTISMNQIEEHATIEAAKTIFLAINDLGLEVESASTCAN